MLPKQAKANTQTRRNEFIPREGFVLKDHSDRVAENRTHLTVGIILREKLDMILECAPNGAGG
jgi:hypothetical protein